MPRRAGRSPRSHRGRHLRVRRPERRTEAVTPERREPTGEGGPEDLLVAYADRLELEKARARAAPGPPWREWFFYTGLKPWLVVGLLTIDAWIVAGWIEYGSYLGLIGSLALAVYLEFLLYRLLWYRPEPRATRTGGDFRRTWSRPVPYGRWTEEAARARAGVSLDGSAAGAEPDPKEFL